jgi:hypothetical protein
VKNASRLCTAAHVSNLDPDDRWDDDAGFGVFGRCCPEYPQYHIEHSTGSGCKYKTRKCKSTSDDEGEVAWGHDR